MTPLLAYSGAVLALALLSSLLVEGRARERLIRMIGWSGIVTGAATFFYGSGRGPWRGLDLAEADAATVGIGIACAWGLVLSLDLEEDRWWSGAVTGVACTGLWVFAASGWTAPTLLFFGCAAVASYVALARAGRAAWLSLAVADLGLVAVLLSDAWARDEWSATATVGPLLTVPLVLSAALRAGVLPRLGTLGALGTPAGPLGPVMVATAFVSLSRWVEQPSPIPAAVLLAAGVAVGAWSILRRRLVPSVVGAWPVAFCGALWFAAGQAAAPAAVAAIIAATVVMLWPDALARGRLARGVVIAGVAPAVTVGALASAAGWSFTSATAGGDAVEVSVWILVSSLLPIGTATALALGVFVARSDQAGGYHPEAVFMTWLLGAGIVAAGLALGPHAVYGALGGTGAAAAFGVAVGLGMLAARRGRYPGVADVAPSAVVELLGPPRLGRWAGGSALALHAAMLVALGWFTVRGLQTGFL